jgi:hypothetical protein
MWQWLSDDANLKVLGAIGAVISFLWTVGWAVYVQTRQSRAHNEARVSSKTAAAEGAQKKRSGRFLGILSAAVAIWTAGLVMAGATWWLWKTYVVEKPAIVSYVCRSENGERCPPGATLVGCGDANPAIENVRKSCKELNIRQVMNSDGGRCGHSALELTCTPK